MINLVVGSAKSQRQINAANPDVRNKKNKNTIGFLAILKTKYPCCQVHILSFLQIDYTSSFENSYNITHLYDHNNLRKNSLSKNPYVFFIIGTI